jgi:hypothetical protein
MSCEFINTPKCPTVKAVADLKSNLGEAANGFTAVDLREIVCKSESVDEARGKDCPVFKNLKGL